ncbi:MAG: radical SAM protein [Oscillospiraceae bacterium]|nr:radical SAM protein [Oscillospiraceae bacterium]
MRCELCPRRCGADRAHGERGYCGMSDRPTAALAALHNWEEPCISGDRGSGTVFFSGCVMRCAYCQNYSVSGGAGREITVERLSEIFLELKEEGAHNINLVNPTHFVPQIIKALDRVKGRLGIPVVYNSGGYERVETLKMLEGYADIYLPDIKYFSEDIAVKLSNAPNYFETAMAAVGEMVRQTGAPVFEGYDSAPSKDEPVPDAILLKGTIIRHLVLPTLYRDSIEVIRRVGERFGGEILFSLMSQYTPFGRVVNDSSLAKLNRRITTFEYRKALDAAQTAGLRGYMQEKSSAKEEYTPEFDMSGL